MSPAAKKRVAQPAASDRGNHVTPKSRLFDDRWDYRPVWTDKSVPPNSKVIKWDFELAAKRTSFADPEHTALRRSAQRALDVIQKNNGATLRPSTVKRVFTDMKSLLRYMVARRINQFSKITAGQANGYIRLTVGSDLSPNRRLGHFKILEYLYDFRLQLDDALAFRPYPNESAFELLGNVYQERRDRKTPVIPDSVAIVLIRHAAKLISDSGPIVEAHLAREGASPCRGQSRAARDRARRSAVAGAGVSDGLKLTRQVTLLRTACLIVLLFFVGVRKGESASFHKASLIKDDEGFLWLDGLTTKLHRKRAKWMVPPVVQQAVSVATELSRPYAEKLAAERKWLQAAIGTAKSPRRKAAYQARLREIDEIKDRLFLCVGARSEPSEFGSRVSVLTNTYDCLRAFIKEFDIRYDGELWRLACHQFRRTFARFMAANLLNLRYLQEHFKHLALDMTAWYDVDDAEMTGLILEYYEQFKAKVLTGIMETGIVAGKAANGFRAERDSLFLGLASQESKDSFVSGLSSAINFKSTGISYCMGFRDRGLCTGVVGCMLDPRNVQECENAFVPAEFLPAWKRMEGRSVRALEQGDLGVVERADQLDLLANTIRPIIAELTNEAEE